MARVNTVYKLNADVVAMLKAQAEARGCTITGYLRALISAEHREPRLDYNPGPRESQICVSFADDDKAKLCTLAARGQSSMTAVIKALVAAENAKPVLGDRGQDTRQTRDVGFRDVEEPAYD